MKFFETSKYYSLKKSTYISLRWIGIVGQLISINLVYFFLSFEFNYFFSSIIVFLGILSNLYLIFQYKIYSGKWIRYQIVINLSALIFLTGGVANPFIIFLLIPSVFSSSNLGFRTNLLLKNINRVVIIFLTFYFIPVKENPWIFF